MRYFEANDFTSLENFETALFQLVKVGLSNEQEHLRRAEIAAEIIAVIRASNMAPTEKIDYYNKAIVSALFSSRIFGALKRGINSLLSWMDTRDNVDPYIQSSSQEMLVAARQEVEKDIYEEPRYTIS